MTVQTPGPVIPAECYVVAIERREVPTPVLEPENQTDILARQQAQVRNARLGHNYWRERANVAEEVGDTNANTQNRCTAGLAAQQ